MIRLACERGGKITPLDLVFPQPCLVVFCFFVFFLTLHPRTAPPPLTPEAGCLVAQAGLELAIYRRKTLDLLSSCLPFSSLELQACIPARAEIRCWVWILELCVCKVSYQPTGSACPQRWQVAPAT